MPLLGLMCGNLEGERVEAFVIIAQMRANQRFNLFSRRHKLFSKLPANSRHVQTWYRYMISSNVGGIIDLVDPITGRAS